MEMNPRIANLMKSVLTQAVSPQLESFDRILLKINKLLESGKDLNDDEVQLLQNVVEYLELSIKNSKEINLQIKRLTDKIQGNEFPS